MLHDYEVSWVSSLIFLAHCYEDSILISGMKKGSEMLSNRRFQGLEERRA